jgi:hypothetical protein
MEGNSIERQLDAEGIANASLDCNIAARVRASLPPRPAPKLDTTPLIDIDMRIAAAVAQERSYWCDVLADFIAAGKQWERALAELRDDVDALRAEIAKQRSAAGPSSSVVPLPPRPGVIRKMRGHAA